MGGPSIHRVADELQEFEGQRVERAGRNADQPIDRLEGQAIDTVRAVKKRLFLDLGNLHVVVHFLKYGSYRVNEARDLDERLTLKCENDTLNIYSCSVKILQDGDQELANYDRSEEDTLSPEFDHQRATATLREADRVVADIHIDQSIFGGVGNIITNEVLWSERLHPLTQGSSLDAETAEQLTAKTVN